MLKKIYHPTLYTISSFFKKAQLINMRVLRTAGVALCTLSLLTLTSCDKNHTAEYERIDRSDIEGYEAFVREYPSSIHVSDAQERIQVAKEEIRMREEEERRQREEQERLRAEAERRQREEEEQRKQLYRTYGSNSLYNGAQPYESFYGKNHHYSSDEPHTEVRVKAAYNSDVIVIIRYNNQNGRVAGHTYVRAGQTATIQLPGGHRYQTFFYYGRGWYPDKPMKNGVKGGFLNDEAYSKDGSPTLLQDNEILSFELTPVLDGNFSTSQSNEGEIF